jgi:hypothetical protein
MNEDELNSSRRMLRELADLAEHASLTGSLSDGIGRAVAKYNTIVERLTREGEVPQGLFTALPGNASYGDLGVEARLLATHLGENGNGCGHGKHKHKDAGVLMRLAPFVSSEDLSNLIREQMRSNADVDMETLTQLAPFLEQSMLGELLRQHIGSAAAARAPSPPTAPAAPAPPSESAAPVDRTPAAAPEAQPPQPEDLLELLKNPHLSEAERADLIEKLTKSVS